MSNPYDSKYRREKSEEEKRPPKREWNQNNNRNDYYKRRKHDNQNNFSQEGNYNQNYKQNRNYDYDYDYDEFQREGEPQRNPNYYPRDGNTYDNFRYDSKGRNDYDKNYRGGGGNRKRGSQQSFRGNRGGGQRGYDPQRNSQHRQEIYSPPRENKFYEKKEENPYKSLTVDTEIHHKVQSSIHSPVSGESTGKSFKQEIEKKEEPKEKGETKEEILLEIEKLDTEISKYEDEIEAMEKDRQNYLLEQQLKREELIKKRKKDVPNPIYESNLKFATEANTAFDHLLWKEYTPGPKQPSELKVYQMNEEKNSENIHEIENYIKESIEYENKRVRPLVKRYNKLKEDYSRQCMVYMRAHPTKSTTRHLNTLAEIPPMLSWEDRNNEYFDEMFLVEDPLEDHKQTRIIEQAWTPEDKKTYFKKFSQYPKDYHKILSFFPHKTYGDIVKFYYNNKHTTELKNIIEQMKNGRKYSRKFDDMGYQNAGRSTNNSTTDLGRIIRPESRYNNFIDDSDIKPKREDERLRWTDVEKQRYLDLFRVHGRNFAEIAKGLHVKNEAQCKNFYNNYKKRLGLDLLLTDENSGYKKKPGRKSSISQTNEEETDSYDPNFPEKKKAKRQVSYWSKEEKDLFMTHYEQFGRDWKKIADLIPNKTQSQVKNFFQNYKVKLGLAPPPEPRGKRKNSVTDEFDESDALSGLTSLADVATDKEAKKVSNVDLLANIALETDKKKDQQNVIPPQMLLNPMLMQMNMRLFQQFKPQQRIAPNPGLLANVGEDTKKMIPSDGNWYNQTFPNNNTSKSFNQASQTKIKEEKYESLENEEDDDDDEYDEDDEIVLEEEDLKSDEMIQEDSKFKTEKSNQSIQNFEIKKEEMKDEDDSDDEQVLASSSPVELESNEKLEFPKTVQ
eukprot:gene11706-4940_t